MGWSNKGDNTLDVEKIKKSENRDIAIFQSANSNLFFYNCKTLIDKLKMNKFPLKE